MLKLAAASGPSARQPATPCGRGMCTRVSMRSTGSRRMVAASAASKPAVLKSVDSVKDSYIFRFDDSEEEAEGAAPPPPPPSPEVAAAAVAAAVPAALPEPVAPPPPAAAAAPAAIATPAAAAPAAAKPDLGANDLPAAGKPKGSPNGAVYVAAMAWAFADVLAGKGGKKGAALKGKGAKMA